MIYGVLQTNQVYHAERKVEHGSNYAGSVSLQLRFSCPLRSSKVSLVVGHGLSEGSNHRN